MALRAQIMLGMLLSLFTAIALAAFIVSIAAHVRGGGQGAAAGAAGDAVSAYINETALER